MDLKKTTFYLFTLFSLMLISCSNDDENKKPVQKYADSGISDKAFKNLLFWFALYATLFCIGVVFAVGADIK